MVEQKNSIIRRKPGGQCCNRTVYGGRKDLMVGAQSADDIVHGAIIRHFHLERGDTLGRKAPQIAPQLELNDH
jgi:hypothetical protein